MESQFKQIYADYSLKVHRLCLGYTGDSMQADDLMQEVFIKIWENLPKFRGESQVSTWLYRIATNEALTFLSQKAKLSGISSEDLQNKTIDNLKADLYFDGDDIQIKLQKAIVTLPEKQQLVFKMKYFEELKYEEIAEILGTSVGALKASYHHAVKKIELYVTSN